MGGPCTAQGFKTLSSERLASADMWCFSQLIRISIVDAARSPGRVAMAYVQWLSGLKAVAPFILMSGFEHPVARDTPGGFFPLIR